MDSKVSVKLISLFLMGSVCLLGYTAMSTWAHPFPVPGAISIDPDTTIYQSSTVGSTVQVFFADSVETLNKLTVDRNYIQINDGTKIGVQSVIDVDLNLTSWEPVPENIPGTVAEFTITSSGVWTSFQFYIGELKAGHWYNVLIDGVLGPSHLTASSEGVIGFAFAGAPGEHDFIIEQLALAPETIRLLGLLMPFIALGIALSVIGWVVSIWKEKKKPKVGDLIDLVIFIVIGVSLLTVIGLVINSLP